MSTTPQPAHQSAAQPMQHPTDTGGKTVVLVAHGQPSAPQPAEDALAQLAQQVADHLPGWDIRSATLATPNRLEEVTRPGALIYPFFMADGWFTTQVLPKRLDAIPHRQLPPFGHDPALPALTAQLISQAPAPPRGAAPSQLLVAAHGSARGAKAAQATERFAAHLRPHLPQLQVVTAYIEQPPYLADVAAQMPANSICLPFFAQSGDHVTGDIPEALTQAEFQGALLQALGTQPRIPQLIANRLLRG